MTKKPETWQDLLDLCGKETAERIWTERLMEITVKSNLFDLVKQALEENDIKKAEELL